MTFEQKKARAIALMDSKKMWRSNYAPPLLRILWRLGIRLPPLPFMPFWQVTVLTGGLWGISWGTVAKLAMRQPFVLFKGLTFQKLCLPGAFRPGDHHNK
uniref:DUF6404 family protein n=1 Tax=Klebsiella pneumoniae TaxID=573 RepID=UPI0038BA9BCC